MPQPAVAKDLLAALAPFAPVSDHVKGQDGAELLNRQRIVSADPVERCQENAGLGGDGDAAFLSDESGRLADEHGVRQPLGGHEDASDCLHFHLRHEVAALGLEFLSHRLGNRLIDNDRVLRRAQHPVVEGLARDDVAHGFLHVRRPLHVCRRVAGTHAVRRLAGAIRGAHEAHPARGQDDRDVAMLHELFSALERHRRHPIDRPFRGPGAARGLGRDFGNSRDALDGGGMGTEYQRATGFERDQDLVDSRGRWIG